VPITPQAITINADLPFNANNAATLRSVRFSPQGGIINGASDLGCLYENGVDLYYIDGAGNQVRITQGGSVTGASGTITGLPSGTASAAFAGSTFTFQSATNTPATMNIGTIVLGQTVASGKNVTIAASGSQTANYNLTLPTALPTTFQSAAVSDTSGNLSFLAIQTTTYTPTVVALSGISSAITANPFMVTQIGNIVSCSGTVSFSGSAPVSVFTITLPIARTGGNFNQGYEAAGLAIGTLSTPAISVGGVQGNVGTQTLVCGLVNASGGSTVGNPTITFQYSLVNF
jgi:hypothetical protein